MTSYLLFENGIKTCIVKGNTLQGVKNKATRLYSASDIIIKTLSDNTVAIKKGHKWRTVSRFTK